MPSSSRAIDRAAGPFVAMSAAPAVVAALIGHYAFAEPMGLAKIAGIAMICLGVMVLTVG